MWTRFLIILGVAALASCGGAAVAVPSELAAWAPFDRPKVDRSSWTSTEATGPVVAITDPGELPELRVAGEEKAKLPLDHTHVKASLFGFVAEVEVTQTFENPHESPIEVVYVFPLPENSAVSAMKMRIGKRVIHAKIDERTHARHRYEEAKEQGKTAALLEQERANIFTQSVANIAPHEKIDVAIRYFQDLSYDAGWYEFVFPMVVGPRFIPGNPTDAAPKGTGTYADTDRVPDASRITPPVLGKGQRSGHDISLELVAHTALPVRDVAVPTHDIVSHVPADGSLELALAEKESIPNRDFVLRYRVAGKEPLASLVTAGDDAGGYFALSVQPPELDVEGLVGRREIIFVVDVSGSMFGVPLALCKTAMRRAIAQLRPVDTFNVLTFSGATAKAFPSVRPANAESIAAALAFLGAAQAGGGTMLDDAVREALSPDVASGRHRYVFFLTDGYVGGDDEIITGSRELVAALAKRGQKARVFSFGVGSSVNRNLLDGLATAGNGIAVYATTREDPAHAVDQFYRYIDSPVLTDVKVAWGDLGASEVYPAAVPDLFASHPVILHGRYRSVPQGPITVRAHVGEREITVPVTVHHVLDGAKGGVLGQLWARAKVEDIEEAGWLGERPNAAAEITELGLEHSLVTAYTSFVAIDDSRVVGDGHPGQIVQPVEVPEGVDGSMAGARPGAPVSTFAPSSPYQYRYMPSAGEEAAVDGRERSRVVVTEQEIRVTEQVLFVEGTAEIRPESAALLHAVAEVLKQNPSITRLGVHGHSDDRGSPEENQRLSEARANAVRDWLVQKEGVDAARLEAKGFGADKPIAPNDTAANRALNRRVEFVILERK
jgi:outer membrane protein OmpA-like peptidoglycan-associated protein/Mg-chelatase subunit ChlD